MAEIDSLRGLLERLGLFGAAWAAPIERVGGVGFCEGELVAPASVMKIQIGLTVAAMVATGELDGTQGRVLNPGRRVPGPVGVSLMRDEVSMSVRDLVVAMLTISDNVATDELIAVAGLARINDLTERLGLRQTRIVSDLQTQLDQLAVAAGFTDFEAMSAHSPEGGGPPRSEIDPAIANSAALDPHRGTRTTAAEAVELLRAIWTDQAGPPPACAEIRYAMQRQLTRQRIASGFGAEITVAAKSGGLMGVVRNEAAVVTFPDGDAYAIAIFTRQSPGTRAPATQIDAAIGAIARGLVDRLRATS
jgi:beta-lactamase class A